ncbi:MAG: hypothetical protein JXB85_11745, partial [Anaerolineales bacterium]|nr:hypothetical protein [Anaerolineales bacterium]
RLCKSFHVISLRLGLHLSYPKNTIEGDYRNSEETFNRVVNGWAEPFGGSLGGLKLRLPNPEDLIILKAVAHRPKDVLDIKSVLASQPAVDKEYTAPGGNNSPKHWRCPDCWLICPPG